MKRSFWGFVRPRLSYEVIPETQPEPITVLPKKEVVLFASTPFREPKEGSVKPGDKVSSGEKISLNGDPDAYVVSPVAGCVREMSGFEGTMGRKMTAVTIEIDQDDEAEADDSFKEYSKSPSLEMAISFLGCLPGKPDFSILNHPDRKVKTIVITGVDRDIKCITNQYIIKTGIASVKTGIDVLRKISSIQDVILAVPEHLVQVAGAAGAGVKAISSQYPAAHPDLLLARLAADGVLDPENTAVFSAESVASLGVAFNTGRIPTTKLFTVVKKDGSLRLISAPIGTPIADVLLTVAQMPGPEDRVVSGGPMTGEAVYSLDYPILPDTDAIVVQDASDIIHSSDTPCTNCGECIRVCPVNVPVNMLVRYIEAGDYETAAEKMDLASCVECGFCSYVCESRIPIFQYIKLAKHAVSRMDTVEESDA